MLKSSNLWHLLSLRTEEKVKFQLNALIKKEEISVWTLPTEINFLKDLIFSRDSDLTSTNVSLSVCLSVRQSVRHQYVEIAYKQQSPVIHESLP